jgi:hypothetical protein
VLKVQEHVGRTVETMVGPVALERPYFYCRACRVGFSPLDDALGLVAGCKQLDMQQAAAQLVTEVPYDTAQSLFGDLTGLPFGSERMHTMTNQVAEGLTVLDVAPSRREIERRIASLRWSLSPSGLGPRHRWGLCPDTSRQRSGGPGGT